MVFWRGSSNSNRCQGLGLCLAVLLGPQGRCVWLPWSARWWCGLHGHGLFPERLAVSRRGVFCYCWFLCLSSSCGCLVLLQTHLQCPLCFPNVLLPTTAGDLINSSRCFQCRVSVLDPAQFSPESGWGPKDSSKTVLSADPPEILTKAWYLGDAEGVEWLLLCPLQSWLWCSLDHFIWISILLQYLSLPWSPNDQNKTKELSVQNNSHRKASAQFQSLRWIAGAEKPAKGGLLCY